MTLKSNTLFNYFLNKFMFTLNYFYQINVNLHLLYLTEIKKIFRLKLTFYLVKQYSETVTEPVYKPEIEDTFKKQF